MQKGPFSNANKTKYSTDVTVLIYIIQSKVLYYLEPNALFDYTKYPLWFSMLIILYVILCNITKL